MSTTELWIAVEGPIDRAVYSKILESNPDVATVRYTIATSKEMPQSSGQGKQVLLEYYKFLRSVGGLDSVLAGKRTVVFFFLDKDVDDLLKTKARSPHVVYTEWYSVENYLFREGDLRLAVVAAAHLDQPSVGSRIPEEPRQWARRAATLWIEWVSFCLFAQRHHLRSPNYGVHQSLMHTDPYSALDSIAQTSLLAQAERELGCSHSEFQRLYSSTRQLVQRRADRGLLDSFFNGKWYKVFLAEDARLIAAGRQYASNSLAERLTTALIATMNYSGSWAGRYHQSISGAVQLLRS